jgi:hypothetical protein
MRGHRYKVQDTTKTSSLANIVRTKYIQSEQKVVEAKEKQRLQTKNPCGRTKNFVRQAFTVRQETLTRKLREAGMHRQAGNTYKTP